MIKILSNLLKSKFSYLGFLIFFNQLLFAQSLTNYSFSTSTSTTFTLLSSATTPTLSAGTVDNGAYNNIPIGFDFWYLGEKYTTISAATNGYLMLGTTIPSGSSYGSTNNLKTGSVRPVIAPLWDDLALTANKVTYKTSGTIGNRIFQIQYLNVKWSRSVGSNNGSISFQVTLDEASGAITFHYRPESANVSSGSASIGLSATATGNNNFISVSNNVSSPSISYSTESSHTARPTTNRRFIFTPSKPVTPSNLTFSAIDTDRITINWQDNEVDELGYSIYYSTDGNTYSLYNTTGPNINTITATGLVSGQNYFWKVYAFREILSDALEGEQGTLGPVPTDFSLSYPFSGNANDASGNSNNGTLQNGPTLVEDRFGIPNSAYSFNGVNQYISTSTLIASPGPQTFTYSVWIKTTTTNGGRIFGFGSSQIGLSSSYDRHLYMTNTGKLAFGVYVSSTRQLITTTNSYNDGNWHNVICSVGPAGIRLYVDGVLQGVNAAITTAEVFGGYWKVGYDALTSWENAPTSNYFNGIIDDISVYNRQLNSAEIMNVNYVKTEEYAYWKNITLNTSNIISGTQTNFPYLIKIIDPDLKLNTNSCDITAGSLDIGKVLSPTGQDISFKLFTGEKLKYEIAKYDPATGELWAWLNLPSVSSSSNLVVKMLFGNPNPPVNNSSDTWSDFRSVFHFDENSYSGTTTDATTLALIGTANSMSASNLVSGKILNAYNFNGAQKIAVAPNSATNITGDYTLSAWINSSSPLVDQKIITNQNSSNAGYKMGLYNGRPENENNGNANRPGSSGVTGTAITVSANTWYHVMGVYSGTTLSMYVNGVPAQVRTAVSAPNIGINLNIGVGEGGNMHYFNGIIDEPRLSATARSASWALSEYQNQNNPTNSGVLPSILSIGNLQAEVSLATAYSGLYFTFEGNVNNNFNGVGNFSSNATNLTTLPATSGLVSVIIPSGKAPVLSADVTLNAINIQSGGQINLNGFALNIACNVYDNGVINGSSGKINFNGSTANQYYYGNATTSSVGNLEVNNSAAGTLTISGANLNIHTGLKLLSGAKLNVQNNSVVTLKSNSISFANVAPLTGASTITGNLTVENYFTGGIGKRGTRMVSSAINESTMRAAGRSIFQQVKEHMVVTGKENGGFDPGNSVSPFAITLTKYNEPAALNVGQFSEITNIITGTVPVELPGSAFFLFYRGNRDNYTPATALTSTKLLSDYVPESFAASFTGPLNQGEISIPITHSNNAGDTNNGFNVVGNPYAATIDWDLVYATNSSIIENQIRIIQPGGAIMTRTKSGSDPAVVVNAIGSPESAQYIQPGQGFYIKKLAAGTSNLIFRESHKSINSAPLRLLTTPNNKPSLMSNLSMSTDPVVTEKQAVIMYFNIKNSQNASDETAVVFKNAYSENLDNNDIPYLTNNSVILGTRSGDGVNLAINYLPELSGQTKFKLLVNASVSGDHTLNFTNLLALGRYKAMLKDYYLNTTIDLSTNPNYSFNIDKTIASTFGTNRFEISFVEGPALKLNLSEFSGQQNVKNIELNFTTATETTTTKTEIEASVDGTNFSKIGEVKGAGISTSPIEYTYLHKTPAQGQNVYRLKQIYADGTFAYSNPITIVFRTVEFNNLKVSRSNQLLNVSWSTVSEVNTVNFSVERSLDGVNFINVGQVLGKGTSSDPSQYAFQDANPPIGKVHYRIKVNFSDALPSYSEVISYNYRDSYIKEFIVDKSATDVLLTWSIEKNASLKQFTLERSSDGLNFTAISNILIGAINELGKYTYFDDEPFDGTNYYRIKQILSDTDPLYSVIKQINFKKIQLQSFSVIQENNDVKINWKTTTETNTSYFEVQRSTDGINFAGIKTISAANNSSTLKDYLVIDNSPIQGKSYYRLKLVYVDADSSLNNAIEIFTKGSRFIKLDLAKRENGVNVAWTAFNDEETTTFEIERSIDGINFIKVGSIPSQIENGNLNYNFTDVNPGYTKLNYRLKEVFEDKSTKTSNIVSIDHILTNVSLKDFIISNSPLGVQINWATSIENGTSRILIEKSNDGTSFSPLTSFAAYNTSTELRSYKYLDITQLAGLYHYRLKFEYLDGGSEYSAIKSFQFYPFKLISFNAQKSNGKATLKWSASHEQNAVSYSLERSNNGQTFTEVTSIKTQGGLLENAYSFIDESAPKGINYYRLNLKYEDNNLLLPIFVFDYLKFVGYLNSFNVVKQGFKTVLDWKTNNDIYIKNFELETSLDGVNFTPLANIPTKSSSVIGNSYNFEYPINSPVNATVYFRIKMVSFENEIDYSPIKSVYNKQTEEVIDGSMLVYPNPAKDYIELATQEENVVVSIFNLSGKLMKSNNFNKNTAIKIDISEFSEGFYYMELRKNDSSKKLIGKGKFFKQ